jgi:hypothetical protein
MVKELARSQLTTLFPSQQPWLRSNLLLQERLCLDFNQRVSIVANIPVFFEIVCLRLATSLKLLFIAIWTSVLVQHRSC